MIFQGSEKNVLKRYYYCAKKYFYYPFYFCTIAPKYIKEQGKCRDDYQNNTHVIFHNKQIKNRKN